MAVSFPANPSSNEVVTDSVTGARWRWDNEKWIADAGGGLMYLPIGGGVMEGPITLDGDASAALNPVSLRQLVDVTGNYLPLTGGVLANPGDLNLNSLLVRGPTTTYDYRFSVNGFNQFVINSGGTDRFVIGAAGNATFAAGLGVGTTLSVGALATLYGGAHVVGATRLQGDVAFEGSLTGSPWLNGFTLNTWASSPVTNDAGLSAIRHNASVHPVSGNATSELIFYLSSAPLNGWTLGQNAVPQMAMRFYSLNASAPVTWVYNRLELQGNLAVWEIANIAGGVFVHGTRSPTMNLWGTSGQGFSFDAGISTAIVPGIATTGLQDTSNYPNIRFYHYAGQTGGGPAADQLGWTTAQLRVGSDGWTVEGRYRDFDPALTTAANPTGRRQQMWIGREAFSWVGPLWTGDGPNSVNTGPGRTVGLLLDGVTGDIEITGNLAGTSNLNFAATGGLGGSPFISHGLTFNRSNNQWRATDIGGMAFQTYGYMYGPDRYYNCDWYYNAGGVTPTWIPWTIGNVVSPSLFLRFTTWGTWRQLQLYGRMTITDYLGVSGAAGIQGPANNTTILLLSNQGTSVPNQILDDRPEVPIGTANPNFNTYINWGANSPTAVFSSSATWNGDGPIGGQNNYALTRMILNMQTWQHDVRWARNDGANGNWIEYWIGRYPNGVRQGPSLSLRLGPLPGAITNIDSVTDIARGYITLNGDTRVTGYRANSGPVSCGPLIFGSGADWDGYGGGYDYNSLSGEWTARRATASAIHNNHAGARLDFCLDSNMTIGAVVTPTPIMTLEKVTNQGATLDFHATRIISDTVFSGTHNNFNGNVYANTFLSVKGTFIVTNPSNVSQCTIDNNTGTITTLGGLNVNIGNVQFNATSGRTVFYNALNLYPIGNPGPAGMDNTSNGTLWWDGANLQIWNGTVWRTVQLV